MSASSSEGIGAFAWLWNFGAFVISAILGWFGGWMAFIGSTKARLTNLEKAASEHNARIQHDLDEVKTDVREIRKLLMEGNVQPLRRRNF